MPDVANLQRNEEYAKLDAIEAKMLVDLLDEQLHSSHEKRPTRKIGDMYDVDDACGDRDSLRRRLFNPGFRGALRSSNDGARLQDLSFSKVNSTLCLRFVGVKSREPAHQC